MEGTPNTRALLELLNRVGGQVTESEIAYQRVRRGDQVDDDLVEDLMELEERGLVRSEMRFEITPAGRDELREAA